MPIHTSHSPIHFSNTLLQYTVGEVDADTSQKEATIYLEHSNGIVWFVASALMCILSMRVNWNKDDKKKTFLCGHILADKVYCNCEKCNRLLLVTDRGTCYIVLGNKTKNIIDRVSDAWYAVHNMNWTDVTDLFILKDVLNILRYCDSDVVLNVCSPVCFLRLVHFVRLFYIYC